MELKVLGERLRMIRKHLGINQQHLANATNLTQPAISRLEKGDEVYASALLAVLGFYHDKVNIDYLLSPDLKEDDKKLLYCSRHEVFQKIERQLAIIANELGDSQKKITALRNKL